MTEKGIGADELRMRYSEEILELKAQLKAKDTILEGYKKDHGKLEVFFSSVMEAITPLTPLKKEEIIAPSTTMSQSECIAVMQISDGHMGAVQEPSEIEDFNEYNPEICRARQLKYVERFMHWVNMHRQSHNIRQAAVIVTGDMISGDIHEELRVTNAFPSPVQVVKAADVLAGQLSLLAAYFDHIDVHFITDDNHARLTKKPQAKEAGYNSLNYLVGYMASIHLAKHENIDFNIYPMFEKVISVSTRQYLISHGHGLTGWMGIPWYAISRHVGKEALNRMSIIMQDVSRAKEIGFNKYVFGHWHTPFDHPMYSCCGSVSGTDAFDHKQGRFAEPSQSSWIVHPKYGEFDRINFNF